MTCNRHVTFAGIFAAVAGWMVCVIFLGYPREAAWMGVFYVLVDVYVCARSGLRQAHQGEP